MDLQHVIINAFKNIDNWQLRHFVVGYSGGMDSTVLLFLMQSLKKKFPEINLSAIHINHGLMQQADQWQQHCEHYCNRLGIPLTSVASTKISSTGKGIEQAARKARQDIFKNLCSPNHILLLAHHANDQTETHIYRLLRGSGIHGLSGIKSNNTINGYEIVRPLLSIDKSSLTEYARLNKLSWIEDNSNSDLQYDRNFLRKNIVPVLKSRWPNLHKNIAKNISLLEQQLQLLDELAEQDSGSLLSDSGYLQLDKLKNFSQYRIQNFLSWWFRNAIDYSLSNSRINAIYNEFINFRVDANSKQSCSDHLLMQSSNRVYLVAKEFLCLKLSDINLNSLLPEDFQQRMEVELSPYTTLIFLFEDEKAFLGLKKLQLKVGFGVGNGKFKFAHKAQSSEIRKIFQQHNVPAWLKPYWPVLRDSDAVAQLSGFGTEEKYKKQLEGVNSHCIFRWSVNRHFEI